MPAAMARVRVLRIHRTGLLMTEAKQVVDSWYIDSQALHRPGACCLYTILQRAVTVMMAWTQGVVIPHRAGLCTGLQPLQERDHYLGRRPMSLWRMPTMLMAMKIQPSMKMAARASW